MTWESVFPELVKVIIGGGLAATASTIYIGRRQARQIEGQEARAQTKLPVEVDSMIVQGAEHTVTIMQAANDRLVAEVARRGTELAELRAENTALRRELAERDGEMDALRSETNALGTQVAEANATAHGALVQLAELNRAYTELRARLASVEEGSAPPTGE